MLKRPGFNPGPYSLPPSLLRRLIEHLAMRRTETLSIFHCHSTIRSKRIEGAISNHGSALAAIQIHNRDTRIVRVQDHGLDFGRQLGFLVSVNLGARVRWRDQYPLSGLQARCLRGASPWRLLVVHSVRLPTDGITGNRIPHISQLYRYLSGGTTSFPEFLQYCD